MLAQPFDYAESVWENLRAYWVPSLMPVKAGEGEGLDPLLDYRLGADEGFFGQVQLNVAADMEAFFNPFTLIATKLRSRRSATGSRSAGSGGRCSRSRPCWC